MNAEFLNSLIQSYESVASKHAGEFTSLWRLDTSFVGGHSPKFQSVAYAVARRIVETMEQVATQMLLITSPSNLQGFVTSGDEVDLELRRAVDTPRFMPRTDAEASSAVQQLVPYALLKNAAGKYLVLRRRASGERPELAGKYTMLVGGHAEEKDWDDAQPESVFERCLRREIEEELIGLNVGAVRRLGVINDVRNRIGSRHLAVLHEVDAGGSAAVRRQTADKEFGRETVEWRSPEEIAKDVRAFDPWSQLVAAKLFGAALPEEHLGPTLFVR
jgi:predicted NUDIX family phosphoesterase